MDNKRVHTTEFCYNFSDNYPETRHKTTYLGLFHHGVTHSRDEKKNIVQKMLFSKTDMAWMAVVLLNLMRD